MCWSMDVNMLGKGNEGRKLRDKWLREKNRSSSERSGRIGVRNRSKLEINHVDIHCIAVFEGKPNMIT